MGRPAIQVIDAETSDLVRRGLPTAKRLGTRMVGRVVSEYRQGGDWIGAGSPDSLNSLMVDLMVVARLTGMRRATLLRPFTAAREPYAERERALRELLSIDAVLVASIKEFSEREVTALSVGMSRKIRERLTAVAIEIQVEGLHVKAGVQRIRKAFDDLGITPRNSYTLENLMRTQTQLAHAAGRYHVDQSPAVQEFLWGYRYVTAGDSRVRPSHAALEDVTMEKDDPRWDTIFPPNGFSCRCQAIPIFTKRTVNRPQSSVVIDGVSVTPGPDRGWAFHPGKRGISMLRMN